MSPKLRMWLLTLAFLSALLAFTLLINGVPAEGDLRQGSRVVFTPPEEINAGAPATLTFQALDEDGELMDGFLIGVQVTQPEYDAGVFKGDFYTIEGVAMVTYNFQDSGEYIIEATLKDETGIPLSTVENFLVYPKSPGAPKIAQLKGWLLLMGVLLFGVLVGVGSTRARNVIE